jgi:hypothetical protein
VNGIVMVQLGEMLRSILVNGKRRRSRGPRQRPEEDVQKLEKALRAASLFAWQKGRSQTESKLAAPMESANLEAALESLNKFIERPVASATDMDLADDDELTQNHRVGDEFDLDPDLDVDDDE